MSITKAIKLKIIKPIDGTWDELGQVLRDLRYNSAKVLNYTIQKSYEWMNFKSSYKQEHGVYPKDKDIFGCSHRNNIYRECREKFTIMNSGNLSQTIGMGISRWNADQKEVMQLRKSIPSYKLNSPIYIANEVLHIEHDEEQGKYIARIGLLSKSYSKKTQYQVEVYCRDNSTEAILNKIISGEYKKGYGQIVFDERKKSWFLIISYSFEAEKKVLNRDRILGVDLGVVFPLYMAINDSLHRYKIKGGEIEQFRKSIEKRKNQLLDQGKYCGDGRRGRGRKKRIAPIDFAKDRVANFRDTTNHKYSRFVIEIALKHQCGIIQMEKLQGISLDDIFLKNWSYFDLQQKIEYKAKEVDIEVRYINPEYTSQRCSKCGYIDKDNRISQNTFRCGKCGFETNADYNAAKNIATPNIEEIINRELKEKLNI